MLALTSNCLAMQGCPVVHLAKVHQGVDHWHTVPLVKNVILRNNASPRTRCKPRYLGLRCFLTLSNTLSAVKVAEIFSARSSPLLVYLPSFWRMFV
jgi:hypothetical protein